MFIAKIHKSYILINLLILILRVKEFWKMQMFHIKIRFLAFWELMKANSDTNFLKTVDVVTQTVVAALAVCVTYSV